MSANWITETVGSANIGLVGENGVVRVEQVHTREHQLVAPASFKSTRWEPQNNNAGVGSAQLLYLRPNGIN